MILFATLSGGSSIVLSRISTPGTPKIFEGSEAFYLHGQGGSLLRSADGLSWDEVGNNRTVRALAQDSTSSVIKLIEFGVSKTQVQSQFYQAEPVNSGAWAAGADLPANFLPVDAVSDFDNIIGILTGNAHSGSEPRSERASQILPYSFSRSDTGLPADVITDLEE